MGKLRRILIKNVNQFCYIVHNACPKSLVLILWFVGIILKLNINVTKQFPSLLYIYPVLSGCVKYNSKLPCSNLLFREKTLTCYIYHTMSTWRKSEKSIPAWIHHIRTKNIQAPWRRPILMLHHPPTLEASIRLTKKSFSSKNYTVGLPPIVTSS